MELLRQVSDLLSYYVWEIGVPVGDQIIPYVIIALLGTGLFLTLRLGFIQVRRLAHGFGVTSGKYDDPDEPGDVSHFQALSTALSATVGIGNIAGVAIAIHWGGPGALFWMWMCAFLGMATKYAEVTLALHYRDVTGVDRDPHRWEGTVSGGPMYYIEKGLGRKWKPLAIYFAFLLSITAFLTGNAAQANTVADALRTEFGVPVAVTGAAIASIVGLVIIGGITRIGRVTGVLSPLMAVIYVLGSLAVLAIHHDRIVPTLGLVVREAFQPSAGVAGTGAGAFLVTMMWGVRRGLFSNEAGQGSAPIAHAAAKTDEPVSEGAVALLEPFIDTIVICTMTGLLVVATGAWNARVPTELTLGGGDISWVVEGHDGSAEPLPAPPAEIRVEDGRQAGAAGSPRLAWHEVVVEEIYADAALARRFTGRVLPASGRAAGDDGATSTSLWGLAAESGAPLTTLAFERGLGRWGRLIVVVSVLLFATSTAISWSYYGDRCANYLYGPRAVMPYKLAFVGMHFLGAVLPLSVVWDLGDIFLGMVILPNLLALLLLSPQVAALTRSYFERRPWIENAEAHRRAVAGRRGRGR
jgi:AGCS family alanine or glycine:cation symporter